MIDKIIILVICLTIISLGSMVYLIYFCISNNLYTDIYNFVNNITTSNNMILPEENYQRYMPTRYQNNIKKEIELVPMKNYVVIQSPEQHFSIGFEIEPLTI